MVRVKLKKGKRRLNVQWKFFDIITIIVVIAFFTATFCIETDKTISSDFINTILSETEIDKNDFITAEYKFQNVLIKFPNLNNNSIISNRDEINKFIENNSLEILNIYNEKDVNNGNLKLEIDYKIEYYSKTFLSITFSGMGYVQRTAHPNNLFYTLNVDLHNLQLIKLEDMVKIDEHFLNLFRKSIKNSETEPNKNAGVYFDDIPNEIILHNLKTESNLFENREVYSYFTNKHINIVYLMPYVVGSYTIIKIRSSVFL